MNPSPSLPPPDIARRATLLALAAAAVAATAHATPCSPPTVLFVCPAGTVKSAIARETLRRAAANAGVAIRVTSRGVHPEDHVSPALRANLRSDGIDPQSEPAIAFSPADTRAADIAIAFDEAADAPGLEHARVWSIPSWNSDYAGARAALAGKVDALLAELRSAKPCRR